MTDPTPPEDLRGAAAPQKELSFTMPVESWRRLFREVGEGRRAALGELYEAAAQRLHGLALWRTGSHEDAAEVVQDVFVRLAEKRLRLAEVKDPRSWLLTVTHRAALDCIRRRTRRAASSLDTCCFLESPVENPDRQVDAERASRLLGQLPDRQRDVIYLKHFADCSFSEAAKITGVPTFTAASRYRLGMKKLRRLMEGGA